MTEHGKKLLPVTVRENCPDPTVALAGASNVAPGAGKFVVGATTEKSFELERAKPFDTVIGKFPAVIASENGMMAVRYGMAEIADDATYAVGRGKLFQFTTEPPFTKFVPNTFSVKLAGPQFGTF